MDETEGDPIMKSNKEKVYDFIQMHSLAGKEGGVSTSYIAEALSLQRTNVSSILNTLVSEGRITKTNGRPVLYLIDQEIHKRGEDCFREMTGCCLLYTSPSPRDRG